MYIPRKLRAVLLVFISVLFIGCGSGKSNSSRSDTRNTGNAPLAKPSIITTQMGDSITVYWDNSNAEEYRVIYWREDEPPEYALTPSLEFTSPDVGTGSYTVIVEAYDELGNSIFSDPTDITVL